ncbi:MAG: SDR family NAD(P)-dependent oxidoreductase, partial [Burkholderiales bacterium]|nr:SDR family NAD(P)-dependent oxidoreductase [Burkholderiales bacterium]
MLAGKIALVTGASRGIGRAIAVRLARGGADVIFTYLRKEAASRMLATDIEAIGQRARFVKANVGKP